MAAPKGNNNNPMGRGKGTPNKITKELRELFKEFAEKNFGRVQEWLDRVAEKDPAEATKLYMAMSERIIGKISSSNVDITSDGKRLNAPAILLPPANPESEAG